VNIDQTVKYLRDAIPQGVHPNPHDTFVVVRLDVVQNAIDSIDWLDKGNGEWRDLYVASNRQRNAAQATARIAIGHLQVVLNKARTHAEQQAADTAARDWLESIGSEVD
jgi:hypothetical protein